MMPCRYNVFVMSLLCMLPAITLTGVTRFNGAAHLTDQKYTALEIRGSAHLTNVAVTDHATIKGSAHLADFTCPELTVKGSCSGTSITVKRADIAGSFQCRNSSFDMLSVHGSCSLSTITINTKLSVYGALSASKVECPLFEGRATKMEFKNSAIKTLIVKKNDNTYCGFFNLWGLLNWKVHDAQQATELYLDNSSVGSIIFQELPGRVILAHGAVVGAVTNGIVENR